MSSVTGRIAQIKQPSGGYVKPSQLTVHKWDDGLRLNPKENIHGSVVGMVVDYLTRFAMGDELLDAFRISWKGAVIAERIFKKEGTVKRARQLLEGIETIDEKAVVNATKLVTYDVWLRNPMNALFVKGEDETNPDAETIQNIIIMIERSIKFWESEGPIVKEGFTFEPNGYTETVRSGDGDYLTADTLWDFKVRRSKPTNKDTLQLLMYWIMGQHSGQTIYRNIKNVGIYNPRFNEAYLLEVSTIPQEIVAKIEKDVICY